MCHKYLHLNSLSVSQSLQWLIDGNVKLCIPSIHGAIDRSFNFWERCLMFRSDNQVIEIFSYQCLYTTQVPIDDKWCVLGHISYYSQGTLQSAKKACESFLLAHFLLDGVPNVEGCSSRGALGMSYPRINFHRFDPNVDHEPIAGGGWGRPSDEWQDPRQLLLWQICWGTVKIQEVRNPKYDPAGSFPAQRFILFSITSTNTAQVVGGMCPINRIQWQAKWSKLFYFHLIL